MENMEKNVNEFVTDLRKEWKTLWESRIDDRFRAEGLADHDYASLFIDRGTVLVATRDYKPPDFNEILERHITPIDIERVNPNPASGGTSKFIRDFITKRNKYTNESAEHKVASKPTRKSQQRKGGRGWKNSRRMKP